jgi:site-specific recombinase XerD
MLLIKALKAFVRARRAEHLSAETIRWYAVKLRPFARRFRGFEVERITADHLRRYINDMQGQRTRYRHAAQKPEQSGGYSPATVRANVRAVRTFLNWYWDEQDLPPQSNPIRRIKTPALPSPEPKAADLEDVIKMLEACPDTPMGRRDRAMIAFLADTGARAGGLLKLTPEALDLDHLRAVVREKGERSRFVSLSEYGLWAIEQWLEVRPAAATTVFCALHHKHFARPLTSAGLHSALERAARKAGIKGRFNPHAFRHGFGRHLSLQGISLAAVSQMMGHSTINVTAQYYARFSTAELQELHRRASPLKGVDHS